MLSAVTVWPWPCDRTMLSAVTVWPCVQCYQLWPCDRDRVTVQCYQPWPCDRAYNVISCDRVTVTVWPYNVISQSHRCSPYTHVQVDVTVWILEITIWYLINHPGPWPCTPTSSFLMCAIKNQLTRSVFYSHFSDSHFDNNR